MTGPMGLTRRQTFAGAAAFAAPPGVAWAQRRSAEPDISGPLPIMSTPFTESGEVDYEALLRELRFISRRGPKGIIWGQIDPMLTDPERQRSMEVLMRASAGQGPKMCLGVQGRDTDEMLKWARIVEALDPPWIISRPPSDGKSQAEYLDYYRALGRATRRPVIIQTTGGGAGAPDTELMIQLAREFPHLGYIKEEMPLDRPMEVVAREKILLAAKPTIKAVFGAAYGKPLLYEMRLGIDGVVTGSGMYTDVLMRIWNMYKRDGQTPQLRTVYSSYFLMRSLSEQIAGVDHYIWRKRGVFTAMTTRRRQPGGIGYTVEQIRLSPSEIAEIEYRYAALEPYLTA